MITGFIIKKYLAQIYDIFGISQFELRKLNNQHHNSYIRVVNYHHLHSEDIFSRQLDFLNKNFDNVNFSQFENFIKTGKLNGNKPGVILTFDDGYYDNFEIGKPCLEKHSMTGWFMIPSDFIGKNGYMSSLQLKNLIKNNHVIGCHTATHHRMSTTDTEDVLNYEIIQSKKQLEKILDIPIDIFCWVGGEEEHYTADAAQKIIEAGYKYSFMTNSYPLTANCKPLNIQRINIEDNWPLSLVKFQICGFMDQRFANKRERVNKLTDVSRLVSIK